MTYDKIRPHHLGRKALLYVRHLKHACSIWPAMLEIDEAGADREIVLLGVMRLETDMARLARLHGWR